MFTKITALLGLAALVAAGAASASAADVQPGGWSRETRQVGSHVTVDVYRRTPHALTGDMPAARTPARGWTHETRQVGSRTIDVYHRR